MNSFEIFAASVGLLYLWLEYKANAWLWLVGIIMPLCFVYIFYGSKFYAGMTVQVYYVAASAYGWWKWKKTARNREETLSIQHIPLKTVWKSAVAFAGLFAILVFALKFTDSGVVYSDAFINALSIVGMWMLAHKYLEQWWVWLAVNIVSAGVYFDAGLKPTAVMYAIYAIGSVFGYFNWKKISLS
ncbi:MAG: nicotinamide riboside transporter PnuC [Tannerella sp.]|jgi:nicotinamide mononucleotide transporter|nr:nicotinamide riboside transporter PnuC [Tannerella sp.]